MIPQPMPEKLKIRPKTICLSAIAVKSNGIHRWLSWSNASIVVSVLLVWFIPMVRVIFIRSAIVLMLMATLAQQKTARFEKSRSYLIQISMTGAEALVKTLLHNDINICFANPGTSEMHFVAALDSHPDMRCILGLFEGGVTGAADGYYRMSDRVAATLLHLGPGFGNGWANLHNAGKAKSGILNIVGDHATAHEQNDSPLNSDLIGLARSISDWLSRPDRAIDLSLEAAKGITAARSWPGHIATLILPADTAWNSAEIDTPNNIRTADRPPRPKNPTDDAITAAAKILKRRNAALLVGDRALYDGTFELAGKIAAHTGCELFVPFRSRRFPRGAGRAFAKRLSPANPINARTLADVRHLVNIGADLPTAFFAYPDQPLDPWHEDTDIWMLADASQNMHGTLERLVIELGAVDAEPAVAAYNPPDLPTGVLSINTIGVVIGALMPENAIVVDESITSGRGFGAPTEHSAPHDWLPNTGGSIGQGLPNAVGAAIACPDRKVICLSGDGSAMYTVQSLWTMARENLDITIVIFANKGYQVLRQELRKVGIEQPGQNAINMLEVENPSLDWQLMARAHGVDAARAEDLPTFIDLYRNALNTPGPFLIEATV